MVTITDSIGCNIVENIWLPADSLVCDIIADFSFTYGDSMNIVSFTNLSSGTFTSWKWDFGDNTFSTAADPVHHYLNNGYYTVYLDVFDSVTGCMDFYDTTVYAEAPSDHSVACQADFDFTVNEDEVSFTNLSSGSITNVFWDFGNEKFSSLNNPVHNYSSGGIYDVYLDIWDSINDCMSSVSKKINIEITGDTAVYCHAEFSRYVDGLKATFTNKSTGNLTNFLWSFGDGKTSKKGNPEHTYDKSGYYEVVLDVFDSVSGCMDAYMKTIYVEAEGDTTANCVAMFNKFVSGMSAGFTNKSSGNITNYFWEFGDGAFSNVSNPLHTYNKAGYYDVSLTVLDSTSGCQDVYAQRIYVGDELDTTVSCVADFTRFVEDTKVTFTNASIGEATHYYWNFGDDAYSNSANPVHTYDEDGYYDVYFSIFDSVSGCQAAVTKEILVQVAEEPVVKANADFSFVVNASNNTINFSDKSKGDITNWYWTFGDGSFMQAINPVYQYAQPGYYDVCLTIFDAASGKSFKKCKSIMVGIQTCNISASYSYVIDNEKKKVTMSDKSTGNINAWFWNFGNGQTSAKQNPVHTYSTPGFYLISLAVRDTVNDCVDYYADFVQVGEADCKADFQYTVSDTTNNTVDFADKSKGAIKNYFWLFDDDGYSVEREPVHDYERSGLYDVSMTVIDSFALCVDYLEKEVQVGNVLCNADFTVYVDSADNKAYFTNKIYGESTQLYWVFGDGTVSTEANPVHTFTVPGYYTVSLNTYNSNNGCMDYHEEYVLITGQGRDMEANFIYIVDDANNEVHFRNRSTGGNSYHWNFGYEGESSTSENPIYTYPGGGYYNVCLTAYGDSGMQNTTCKKIRVAPEEDQNCKADFFFTVDDATQTVALADMSSGGPDAWEWSFDDSTSNSTEQNPVHVFDAPGYYRVGLTIENTSTGCRSTHFELVNVAEGNNGIRCAFSFLVDTANLKASSYPVDFIGVSHGESAKLKWDFGDGSSDSTTTSPTHVYTEQGEYNVCMTISDPLTGVEHQFCEMVKVGMTDITPVAEETGITLVNYPNPFRHYTVIKYGLDEESAVNLTVFAIGGTEVVTLVNTTKSAGEHKLLWDGAGLSPGMYYMRMIVGDEVIINKVVKE